MRILYLTPCFHGYEYALIPSDAIAEGQSHIGEFVGLRRGTGCGCQVCGYEDCTRVACCCSEYGHVDCVNEAGVAIRHGESG